MRTRRLLAAGLVAALALTACTSDDEPDSDATTSEPADDASSPADSASDAAGSSQLAAVALTFDGQRVPTSEACNGVDGAVRASTPGEVTIFLIREEGIAMRYLAEGHQADTSDVEVSEVGVSTLYTTVFETEDVPRIEVTMEVSDTSGLPDCT